MSTRISSHTQSTLNSTSLFHAEALRAKKAQQASRGGLVGENFSELGSVGAERALALQESLTSLSAYQKNITIAESRLQITETIITKIVSINSDVQGNVIRMSSPGEQNWNLGVEDAVHKLEQLVAFLNQADGNQYIFGNGSIEAPVSIEGLPIPPTVGSVANFDYSRAGHTTQTVQVGSDEPDLDCFISAEEPCFEQMIRGLMMLKTASVGDHDRLQAASQLVKESFEGLLKLQSKCGFSTQRIDLTKNMYESRRLHLEEAYHNVSSLDFAEVISELNSSDAQFKLSLDVTRILTDITSVERILG